MVLPEAGPLLPADRIEGKMTTQTDKLQMTAPLRPAAWWLRRLASGWLCALALNASAATAATFASLAQEAFERSRLP